MRHVKLVSGLATAVCALGIAASPAAAVNMHHFVASKLGKSPVSEETPAKSRGIGLGPQAFKFGGIHITCERARAAGIINKTEFKDFATGVKYGECTTEIKFGAKEVAHIKTTFNAGKPVDYVYHINGYAEIGTEAEEEGTEVKISGGNATFAIPGLKCTINWPAQTVPAKAAKKPEGEYSFAVYSNEAVATTMLKAFPSGFQQRLDIANEFKQMEYSVENGACSEFEKTEGKGGKYVGSLQEYIVGGNLSYQ